MGSRGWRWCTRCRVRDQATATSLASNACFRWLRSRRCVMRFPRGLAAIRVIAAVAATNQGCGCGGDDEGAAAQGCGSDCQQVCGTPLPVGVVGAYTSVARTDEGKIWIAGYNDSSVSQAGAFLYGDL